MKKFIFIFAILLSFSQTAKADTKDILDIVNTGMKIYNLLFGESNTNVQLDKTRNYKSCDFSIKPIQRWQIRSEPAGIKPAPNKIETLWLQKDEAMMQVTCIPKAASLTLENWLQGTLKNLPKSFTNYKVLAHEAASYNNRPAHWIAYQGAPNGYDELQRGYLLLVDRATGTGLIVSISVPAQKYDDYADAYRAGIKSISFGK